MTRKRPSSGSAGRSPKDAARGCTGSATSVGAPSGADVAVEVAEGAAARPTVDGASVVSAGAVVVVRPGTTSSRHPAGSPIELDTAPASPAASSTVRTKSTAVATGPVGSSTPTSSRSIDANLASTSQDVFAVAGVAQTPPARTSANASPRQRDFVPSPIAPVCMNAHSYTRVISVVLLRPLCYAHSVVLTQAGRVRW